MSSNGLIPRMPLSIISGDNQDPNQLASIFNSVAAQNGGQMPQQYTDWLQYTANTPAPGSQQWAQQQLGLAGALGPAQPAQAVQPIQPVMQKQPVVDPNSLPAPIFRYSAPVK